MRPGQRRVLYSLFGVVEHSGRLTSGHYTAYVRVRRRHDRLTVNPALLTPLVTDAFRTACERARQRAERTEPSASEPAQNGTQTAGASEASQTAPSGVQTTEESEPKPGPEPDQEPKPEPETDQATTPEPEPDQVTKPEPKPKPEPDQEMKPEPKPEPDQKIKPQPEPEPEEEEPKPEVGRWFHVSDTHVTEVTLDKVLKAQAYMLFYERIV